MSIDKSLILVILYISLNSVTIGVFILYNIIKALCDENGISPSGLCKALNIGINSLGDLKSGRVKTLSTDKISKIADYFNVSTDYILGKTNIKEKAPAAPEGEGGDIASDLTHYMEILESQESLMFDGEPLDDESKELLLISLKNTMELAKKMKERKKSGLSDNK